MSWRHPRDNVGCSGTMSTRTNKVLKSVVRDLHSHSVISMKKMYNFVLIPETVALGSSPVPTAGPTHHLGLPTLPPIP